MDYFVHALLVYLACHRLVQAQNVANFVDDIRSQGVDVDEVSFTNWGGTISKGSLYKFTPTDVSEIKKIVSTAYNYQVRVRATGSTHAFSDLFSDSSSVWIDMSNYRSNAEDRIYMTSPSFMRTYPQVTLNPSVSMGDFAQFMSDNGISLPSLPAVFSPSMMGLTATGAHGMNWKDGPISSHLVNVQFVNGEGESRVFDIDQNGDAFNLFRSHLGLCGIITEMTFRVQAWDLMTKYTEVRISFDDLFYNSTALRILLEENHSWLASWDVFSSLTAQQVADIQINGGVTDSWVPEDDMAELTVLQEMEGATSEILDAASDGTVFSANFTLRGEFYSEAEIVYGFHPNLGELDPVAENTEPIHCEFGFSVKENTFEEVEDILEILFRETKSYALTHTSLPMTTVQFAFFRHNTTCLLCHTNVADSSVNSNSHSHVIFMVNFVLELSHMPEFDTLIKTLYTAWKDSNLQGMPHFGKYIPEDSDIINDIISMLGGKISDFRALRDGVGLDSIDLFTNSYLDQIVFHDKQRVRDGGSGFGSKGNQLQGSSISAMLVILLSVFRQQWK